MACIVKCTMRFHRITLKHRYIAVADIILVHFGWRIISVSFCTKKPAIIFHTQIAHGMSNVDIILSGGPGNGHESTIPDKISLFAWVMPHGCVEYRPMVLDGITLPAWAPGPLIPNPNYNPDEPF